jgi:cytochrome c oxidase subunit II
MIKVHQYEQIWIAISFAAIGLMFVALLTAGLSLGIKMPGDMGMVNPQQLNQHPPFDKPGVTEVSPGKYQVVMIARIWQFTPNKIEVPAGSEVTFKVTSADVTHGMLLENTNVNVMVVPGQITQFTVKLTKSGKYTFVCHEYCGAGHQTMTGEITVTP